MTKEMINKSNQLTSITFWLKNTDSVTKQIINNYIQNYLDIKKIINIQRLS